MSRESRPLTGRKVFAIAAVSFGVILGANLLLAYQAVSTFSGLVVPNSYIASQEFDARRRAQEALGWTLDLGHDDATLTVRLTDAAGRTVRPDALEVIVGRPTTAATDVVVEMQPTPEGYAGHVELAPGNWLVQLRARAADGTDYTVRHALFVRPQT
jgi:nitrogen fixation protein FixH